MLCNKKDKPPPRLQRWKRLCYLQNSKIDRIREFKLQDVGFEFIILIKGVFFSGTADADAPAIQ